MDGLVMVPSMYELTSAELKNKTGWPGYSSGKSLVLCLLLWCFFWTDFCVIG